MAGSEEVRALELSRADIMEMLAALRARAEEFGKLVKRLRAEGCDKEADTLDGRISDIRERLCTQLAAELGPGGEAPPAEPQA